MGESAKFRLFVALDLPEAVRAQIDAWSATELGDPALRPVRAESLHITLCFLGWRPEGEVDRVAAILEDLPGDPVGVTLSGPVGKPPRRPSFFALEADSGGAVALQGALSHALSGLGPYEPERRRFWPHLTLARVRPERGGRRPQRVVTPPGELPEALREPWEAVRVSLYRSNLRPEGAQYVSLAAKDLTKTR